MAKLETLFEENGLQGIIPYAFGMKGQGYQFLCKKLMGALTFYVVIAEDTGMPFVFAENDKVYFSIYSTEQGALSRCNVLAMDNFKAAAAILSTEDWAGRLWKRYRDLGATHIYIDDAVWVRITDLAPTATYNGILNNMTPLRNAILNPALYMLQQFNSAGIQNDGLDSYFWSVFKESRLYAPQRPVVQLKPGESLTPENSEYHYITLEDGTKAVLCFTDAEFLEIYAQANQLKPEDYMAASTPGYQDLREFLNANPGLAMVLNYYSGDFLFTQDTFLEFETTALNQSALDAAQDAPNTY